MLYNFMLSCFNFNLTRIEYFSTLLLTAALLLKGLTSSAVNSEA